MPQTPLRGAYQLMTDTGAYTPVTACGASWTLRRTTSSSSVVDRPARTALNAPTAGGLSACIGEERLLEDDQIPDRVECGHQPISLRRQSVRIVNDLLRPRGGGPTGPKSTWGQGPERGVL